MAAALLAATGGASAGLAGVREGIDAWQAGDYQRAVSEWRKPADAGDADAQFNLAQAYKLGRGVPTDLRAAQDLYHKAAVQGHEQAQANLGLILFQNGDRRGALPWIQKAADRGEPRAQYVLGTALFNGDLLPRDWPRAYALMTRAAGAGLPQASTSLAQMNQHIPEGQRKQGSAIAANMAKAGLQKPVNLDQVAAVSPVRPAPAPTTSTPSPDQAPAPVAKSKPVAQPTTPAAKDKAAAAAKPASVAAKPKTEPTPRKPPSADPKPQPAVTAAAKPAPAGKWRVQLGAYSSAASARAAWGAIGVGALKGLQPYVVKAGAVHRLQAGPFATRSAAEKACASATAARKACFVTGG